MSIVLVVSDEQSAFEEAGAGIEQFGDPLACGQFAGFVLLFDFGGAATGAEALFELVELIDEKAHVRGAGDGGRGGGGFGGHFSNHCFTIRSRTRAVRISGACPMERRDRNRKPTNAAQIPINVRVLTWRTLASDGVSCTGTNRAQVEISVSK